MANRENRLREFIISNIDVIITEEDIIGWVVNEFEPDDVFSAKVLQEWAEDNGYVKAGEN